MGDILGGRQMTNNALTTEFYQQNSSSIVLLIGAIMLIYLKQTGKLTSITDMLAQEGTGADLAKGNSNATSSGLKLGNGSSSGYYPSVQYHGVKYRADQCGRFVKNLLKENGVNVSTLGSLPRVAKNYNTIEPGDVVYLGPTAAIPTQHWALVGNDGVHLLELITNRQGLVGVENKRTLASQWSRVKQVYRPNY
jgi:hypothetical protein